MKKPKSEKSIFLPPLIDPHVQTPTSDEAPPSILHQVFYLLLILCRFFFQSLFHLSSISLPPSNTRILVFPHPHHNPSLFGFFTIICLLLSYYYATPPPFSLLQLSPKLLSLLLFFISDFPLQIFSSFLSSKFLIKNFESQPNQNIRKARFPFFFLFSFFHSFTLLGFFSVLFQAVLSRLGVFTHG